MAGDVVSLFQQVEFDVVAIEGMHCRLWLCCRFVPLGRARVVEGRGVETGAFADRLEAFFSAGSQFSGRCQDAACPMLARCSVSLLGNGGHRCDLCRGQQLRMSQVMARVHFANAM